MLADHSETLSQIAQLWLASSKAYLKYSTIVKYSSLLQSYIIPQLGSYSITMITDDAISKFVSYLLNYGGKSGSGLKPKTVSDVLSILRAIKKYAVSRNYMVNFTLSNVPLKQQQRHLRVFTTQEQERLLHYLKSNSSLSNLGVLLCLFTGIRIGELCALKWSDISLNEKTLYIHQTMQQLHVDNSETKTQVIISSPKSDCSVRVVPLPEIILPEILKMYKGQNAFFLTGNDSFIEPRTMQNRFKSILRACNIKDANFHALRHTFATRCVEVGFDVKSLSEILGHSNVNITLNRYVHPTMDLKRENMSKLSNLFAVK